MSEKRAVGILNGWRCPSCGALVKGPKEPVGPILGGCKSCGADLIFEKKLQEFNYTGFQRDLPDPPLVYRVPLSFKEVSENYLFPNLRENGGSWVIIAFSKHPKFLKALEKMAKDRGLSLSEVIIGFAGRGYKDWVLTGSK